MFKNPVSGTRLPGFKSQLASGCGNLSKLFKLPVLQCLPRIKREQWDLSQRVVMKTE